MIIKEHIVGAISSILGNKLRSGLSMLGIIIGVFAIIVMLALGQGTSSQIVDRFNSMGANLITISPGGANRSNVRSIGGSNSSTLIDDDFLSYVKQIDGIKNVSPTVSTSRQLIYGTYNTNAQIIGVSPIYEKLKNLTLSNGNFIIDDDLLETKKIVVLGYQVAQNVFGTEDPIGKEIRLENDIFVVGGVLNDNSQANNRIFVPLTTAMQKLIGTHYYSSLDVEVADIQKMEFMKSFIEQELRTYLKVNSSDDSPFSVNSLSEILSSVKEVTATMSMFLAGIAAVSLIVGGIGVMNIMLVSVVERTKEIGIRKALGATKSDILYQFLVESMFISIIAGILGILISFGAVAILNKFIKAVITQNSILIAFVSVVFIGIVFGILPASKASKLKPIDALRYE